MSVQAFPKNVQFTDQTLHLLTTKSNYDSSYYRNQPFYICQITFQRKHC